MPIAERIPYTDRMSFAALRSRRALFMPLLLVALLFAQGLRLCLHAPHDAEADHVHTTMLHVESDLNTDGDGDDSPGDQHVPMTLAFFKKVADAAPWVMLVALAVLFLLPPVVDRPAAGPVAALPLTGGHRWRPPLRAPPR